MRTYTSREALFAAVLGEAAPEEGVDEWMQEREYLMPAILLDGGLWSVDPVAAGDELEQLGEDDRATRKNLRAAVVAAVDAGMSEAEVARRSGVTRMTVRAWIGK